MNSKEKKVLILGVEGFPTGGARIEKLKLFGKALLNDENINVQFLSNSWCNLPKGKLPNRGTIEGLHYLYTSILTYRPKSFIIRRIVKFFGKANEVFYLLTHKYDAAIVSVVSGKFFPLFKYWLISRIKGYKIYYPHHEYESNILKSGNLLKKVNVLLFKKFGFKIVDGVFPISTFLADNIKEKNINLPQLLIPALVDFEIFDKARNENISDNKENYYLYCGSLGYFEVVDFILESYEKISDNHFKLYLICAGNKYQKENLAKRIESSHKKNLITTYEFLSYNELVYKYNNAKGLLIPLRNTVQDKARFPHKVGEYTASQRPIITTNIGDIPLYFKDSENALIADNYTVDSYAKKMEFIIKEPSASRIIGQNGYIIGRNFFDYEKYGKKIMKFIFNN